MFEERLSFLEFALDKVTTAVEEMLIGMEERKKGEKDVDGVKQGKNIYCIQRCTRFENPEGGSLRFLPNFGREGKKGL
jgi:hypothetical protein